MKVLVASLPMQDNDDPEIFAAEPILDWQRTEAGQWVINHSIGKPTYNIQADTDTWMGYTVNITADLSEEDLSYWLLKWSDWRMK